MDPPNEFGPPASRDQRSKTSAEPTNTHQSATARLERTHLPQGATFRTGPHILSPPQEHEDWYDDQYTSPSQYDQSSIPTTFERNHPPTPPAHEDRFDALRAWSEQQALGRGQITPAQHRYTGTAALPRFHHTTVGDQWQHNPHVASAQPLRAQPSTVGTVRNDGLPIHAPTARHSRADEVRKQGNLVRGRTKAIQRDPQLLSQTIYHSPANHGFPNVAPSPPIQQWPTSALGVRPSRLSTPTRRNEHIHSTSTATSARPSPGHDGITPLDKKTVQKIEQFARKAAVSREKRAKIKQKAAAKVSMKRKNTRHSPERVAATPAPPLRPSYTSPYALQGTQGYLPTPATPIPQPPQHGLPSINRFDPYGNPYAMHPPPSPDHLHHPHMYGQPHQSQVHARTQQYAPGPFPMHHPSQGLPPSIDNSSQFYQDPVADTNYDNYLTAIRQPSQAQYQPTRPAVTGVFRRPQPPRRQQVLRPKAPSLEPIDYDSLGQLITNTYADYKYSVIHYTLPTTSSYTFAQCFLSDLFTMNLPSDLYKWTTYSTPGFISTGTRLSFIVLHNASDPFERGNPPITTTSIGVYGLSHDEIHWITYAPGLKWLFEWCENNGGISQKSKWMWNMERASEKRFHRAYWMAANMGMMGGLLNRGDVRDDDDMFGVLEDSEEEWEIKEEDMQGAEEWGVGVEMAEEVWEQVRKEAAETDGVQAEHVVTASSEWDTVD